MNHVILLILFPLSYNTFLIFLTDNDFRFLLCFTFDDIFTGYCDLHYSVLMMCVDFLFLHY